RGMPFDGRVGLPERDRVQEDPGAGQDRAHVRTCPSCGWLFLDPRGRRRWCSMATCGNRAKVRAHAARTAAS
ncbi:CGNR zinc finger domain-containing protein, partial [Kribbella sp. NPDC004138]